MKKQIFATALLAGSIATPAMAVELSANGGLVSEYVFRGVPSSDGSAAAQGGLDLNWDAGFYLGTWGSSVDFDGSDGIEVDLYGGYAGEYEDFSYGIGATYYTYTDQADDDYFEFNLSGGWKWFGVEYAAGEYDAPGGEIDYDYWAVTAEYEGFYAKYGSLGDDLFDDVDADSFEAGYTNTLSVDGNDLFDYSISYVYSEDGLLIGSSSNNRVIFGITKSFDINL